LESNERLVAYEDGHYILVGRYGMGRYILTAGDTLELFHQARFQQVWVVRGEYHGWYYVTAEGQRARFALGMRARLSSVSFESLIR
jgi:hypothetical protein